MGKRFYCGICKERSLFEHIRSFRCGHCFCAPCVVKNKKSGNILCPFCRAVIKNDNGHPIYVTFNDPDVDDSDAPSSDALPETVVRQARYVTKRLDRMDAGSSSLKTVKMAEDHLSNVAALLEPSKLVEELLEKIANFKERIIPVFATSEDRQRRITELEELHHNDERRLRTRQHEIDKLKDSQRLLRAEQESLQLLTDQAIASAGKATKEVLTLREEHQKLWNEREAVLKNLANEKEKDEELRKYKGFCDDYKKKETLNKAKMKGLRQMNSELKHQIDELRSRGDMDESLRVVDRSHLIDEDFDDLGTEDVDFIFDDRHSSPSNRPPLVRGYLTRPSGNHNPLANRPLAQIKQDDIDLDADIRPLPTYKSDWTFPPSKKRKVEPSDIQPSSQFKAGRGLPIPLRLDAKGHTVGAVQLGSRLRMEK